MNQRRFLSPTVIVYPCGFLQGGIVNLLNLGMVFYMNDRFGSNTTQVSISYALFTIAYMVACFSVKPLFRRMTVQQCLMTACGTMLLCELCILRSNSFRQLMVPYSIYGFISAFYWSPLGSWLMGQLEGKELSRKTGIYNVCWSSGALIAPFLTGLLTARNPLYPLYVCVAGTSVLVLLSIVAQYFTEKVMAVSSGPVETVKTSERQTVLRYPSWYGLTAGWFAVGLLLNTFPLATRDNFGFSPETSGFLISMETVTSTLTMFLMGMTVVWQRKFSQLVGCHTLLMLLCLLMPLCRQPWMALLDMMGIGCTLGHIYTTSLFHGAVGSRNRTMRIALHESLLSAGCLIGGLISGYANDTFGFANSCIMVALLIFTAVVHDVIWWVLARKHHLE